MKEIKIRRVIRAISVAFFWCWESRNWWSGKSKRGGERCAQKAKCRTYAVVSLTQRHGYNGIVCSCILLGTTAVSRPGVAWLSCRSASQVHERTQ